MRSYESFTVIEGTFVLFKGSQSPLSNFYRKIFYNSEGVRFFTAEHHYQYCKAIRFKDYRMARRIVNVRSPLMAKRLGRQISNFNEFTWSTIKKNVMYETLKLKFQNRSMKNELRRFYLMSGSNRKRTFIEYSDNDTYWGARLIDNDAAINYQNLQGQNQMGRILTRIASELFDD
uniref:DUF1768 domain-containing protein n=1 Tax=Strongyloides papillosus TaxID=174720 RepID=A0A0N5C1Q1_STREA